MSKIDILVVIDRSGSMGHLWPDTIGVQVNVKVTP